MLGPVRNTKYEPPVGDAAWNSSYGTAIDEAMAAADAYEAVRKSDPIAAAKALSDTHDKLAEAVVNNDGQVDALEASLQTFVQKVGDLEKAAAAVAK